jgi:hypothetical protein
MYCHVKGRKVCPPADLTLSLLADLFNKPPNYTGRENSPPAILITSLVRGNSPQET